MQSTASQPTVAVIIVTYNSSTFINRCLDSVATSEFSPVATIVIDNASSDNTVDIVSNRQDCGIISLSDNRGFAAGVNRGIREALDKSADYVFLLNPDATIERGCLGGLVAELLAHPEASCASPFIRSEPAGNPWYAGARLDFVRQSFEHDVVEPSLSGPSLVRVTGRPTGCAMLVPVELIRRVGDLDESFFLYWEETEWFLRLAKAGGAALYVGTAVAHHWVSSSTGGWGSPFYEYYYIRNWCRLTGIECHLTRAQTVKRVLPSLVTRWRHMIAQKGFIAGFRGFGAGVRGISDFWRGRFGARHG